MTETDSEFLDRVRGYLLANIEPDDAGRVLALARRGAAADTKPQTSGETVRGEVTADAGWKQAMEAAAKAVEQTLFTRSCTCSFEAEAAIRALPPPPDAVNDAGWRPIETAPRTGREMILMIGPSRFPNVAFSNTWWQSGSSVECTPTHWMPLPPPPEQEKKEEADGK